jgi:two-component system response regulator MprA
VSRRLVLIVDDDADIREILAEILVEVGFEVLTAANGREALALVRDAGLRPSLIVLDLMMPIMDGYGFLEQRSSDPALASIPVAIVTAGHGVDRARIGEGIPIVAKPFEAPHLLDVLHALGSGGAPPR